MIEKNTPEIWDKFWQKKDIDKVYPSSPSVLDTIKSHFQIPDLKVLEVGAGSGRDSLALAGDGAEVTVLDSSEKSLEVIKALCTRSGLSGVAEDVAKIVISTAVLIAVFLVN